MVRVERGSAPHCLPCFIAMQVVQNCTWARHTPQVFWRVVADVQNTINHALLQGRRQRFACTKQQNARRVKRLLILHASSISTPSSSECSNSFFKGDVCGKELVEADNLKHVFDLWVKIDQLQVPVIRLCLCQYICQSPQTRAVDIPDL
jgi:hypothetical protein